MDLKRGVHADTMAELESGAFNAIIMVHVDWPGAPVYAHSGTGSFDWDGHIWGGVGEFGSIRLPQEMGGMAQSPAEIRVVGLTDKLFGYLDDPIRDRDVEVYFATVSERAGAVLIGDPVPVWSGYADAMAFEEEATDGGVSYGLILGSRSGPSARANASAHHTYEDQQRAFPGDTAGRWVINAEAEGDKLTWPES